MNFYDRLFLVLLVLVLSLSSEQAHAQTSSYGELQAAYLYNFAKYIQWPNEGQQFIIGVYDDTDIMKDLDVILKEKKVRGKAIVIKKVKSTETLHECNIVYLSESNSRSLNSLITAVGEKSILIVTEEDLIRKGATISFIVEDDKLKFKLKKTALDQAGLIASDGLLKLALLY